VGIVELDVTEPRMARTTGTAYFQRVCGCGRFPTLTPRGLPMAEDDAHRRVEPRTAIPGSGMLTEPDRIRALEDDVERKKRAWRPPPAEGFSSVLTRTPAKEHERVGTYIPSDERLHARENDDGAAKRNEAQANASTSAPESLALPLAVDLDEDRADTQQALATPEPATPESARTGAAGVDDRRNTRRPRPNEMKDPRIEAVNRMLDAQRQKKGA
jgi:hypothetical protein